MTKPLFLTGYRGTGKTTVAKLIARKLGWEWVDADDALEQAAGKTIAAIFADEGEPAFRDLEEKIVAQLCQRGKTVIALGGGAVLRETTRGRLREAGPIVWLTATAETLASRIAGDASTEDRRPNLTNLPAREEIRRLLAEREPLYRECATFTQDTEARSPDEIASEIVQQLGAISTESE